MRVGIHCLCPVPDSQQGLYDSHGIRATVGVLAGLKGLGMPVVACLPKDLTGKPLEDSEVEARKADILLGGSSSDDGADDEGAEREDSV